MRLMVAGRSVHLYNGGKNPAPDALARQPAVVFVHGVQQDHSCWTQQSRWFGHHGYGVLAPDLPGYGKSAGDALRSIEALADWIAALLDAAGIAQAHVVGHSMGSLVALEFAVRHPARALSAALIGAALPMPVAPALLGAARDDEARAAEMVNDWSFSAAGQFGGNRVPGLWMLGVNKRLMARQKPGVFHAGLAACNAYGRTLESLATIAAPVLVIAGGRDRMTSPKAARAIAAAIPGARFVVLPGSGHAMMAERPDEVLDALGDFIGGQGVS